MAESGSLRSAAAAAASVAGDAAASAGFTPRGLGLGFSGVGSLRPKLGFDDRLLEQALAPPAPASASSTEMPPALSPKMVTFFGSPPKLAILACTHFSAAIWSMLP